MFLTTIVIVVQCIIFAIEIFNCFTDGLIPVDTFNRYCCNILDVYRFFDICLTQIAPNIIDSFFGFFCRVCLYIASGNNNMLVIVSIVQHCGTYISAWCIES